MAVREALAAVRQALLHGERVGQLSDEVAELAGRVESDFGVIYREQRELDRRVSRLEGGFAVLERLGRRG